MYPRVSGTAEGSQFGDQPDSLAHLAELGASQRLPQLGLSHQDDLQ